MITSLMYQMPKKKSEADVIVDNAINRLLINLYHANMQKQFLKQNDQKQ